MCMHIRLADRSTMLHAYSRDCFADPPLSPTLLDFQQEALRICKQRRWLCLVDGLPRMKSVSSGVASKSVGFPWWRGAQDEDDM